MELSFSSSWIFCFDLKASHSFITARTPQSWRTAEPIHSSLRHEEIIRCHVALLGEKCRWPHNQDSFLVVLIHQRWGTQSWCRWLHQPIDDGLLPKLTAERLRHQHRLKRSVQNPFWTHSFRKSPNVFCACCHWGQLWSWRPNFRVWSPQRGLLEQPSFESPPILFVRSFSKLLSPPKDFELRHRWLQANFSNFWQPLLLRLLSFGESHPQLGSSIILFIFATHLSSSTAMSGSAQPVSQLLNLFFFLLLIFQIFLLNFNLSYWCLLSQPPSGGQSISDFLFDCDPLLSVIASLAFRRT